jgi:Tfp pilus assembly protein PilX
MQADPRALRSGERGSAYIITLLALVVLTILGLGLSLITQTEMQVGATEVTQQRLLYSADSGISKATARAVTKFQCDPTDADQFEIFDQDLTSSTLFTGLRQQVAISVVLPVVNAPCALCQINNAAGSEQYGEQNYSNMSYAVSSEATRIRAGSTDALGQREIGSMIAVQPWPPSVCQQYVKLPVAEKVRM